MRSAASLSPQGQAGRNAFQTLAVLESLLLTPIGPPPDLPKRFFLGGLMKPIVPAQGLTLGGG